MKKQTTNLHYKYTALGFVFLILFFSLLHASEPAHTPTTSASLLQSHYLCQSVNVITGDYCEAATDFTHPSDPYLKIRRSYSNQDGWNFNLPLSRSALPDGLDSPFTFNYNSAGHLTSINKNNSKTPSIQIDYPTHPGILLQLNDNTLSYEFETPDGRLGVPHWQVNKITRNSTELCRYSYRPHPYLRRQLLERKDEPNGNFLINEYYDQKENLVGDVTVVIEDPVRNRLTGRVKLQKAPVGNDPTPIITSRYFYHPGYTEVLDALNRKTVYHYKSDRLTAIEYYNKETLYRTERLFWEKDKVSKNWNLTAKSWHDAEGNALKCQTFTYDPQGNQTSETIYGALSGKETPFPIINEQGKVLENGVESYSIKRKYTKNDTSRTVIETHDNGKVIVHSYNKATSLKTAEFTGTDTAILKRCFYEYNDQRQLTAVYIDNGRSLYIHDLQDVTERYATFFTYGTFTLPEITEEKYMDAGSGAYLTIRRTVCSYNEQGYLSKKQIFNSDGSIHLSSTYSYDSFGRLIKEINDSGTGFEKTYDTSGNLLTESFIENNTLLQQTRYTYDLTGRLILCERSGSDGLSNSCQYQYNHAGEKTGETDNYGNTINYSYDDLGRLISTVFPPVISGQITPQSPVNRYGYDTLDNMTESSDANDNMTSIHYNVYGKPVEKVHPDQTRELFQYTLDGNLVETIDAKGIKTTYTRDVLGRETLVEVRDAASHLRYTLESIYSAFHLKQTVKDGKLKTFYTYDQAGRIANKHQLFAEGWQNVEYTYDNAGRVDSQTETWSDDARQGLITKYTYDSRGDLSKTTAYDLAGSLLKETFAPSANHAISPEEDTVTNAHGQLVRQTTSTDSKGQTTVLTYDAIGRVDSQLIKNFYGDTKKHTGFQYDLAGNKTKEVHYDPQTAAVMKVNKWTYDSCNRLKSAIEAADTQDARITHYSYNASGQLEQIIKPNGVIITQNYSTLGQIEDYYASDLSFKYHFIYNDQGHLTKVEDHVHGTCTNRTVNTFGQVTCEELGNGLKINNTYDAIGRKIKLQLPDSSSAVYRYDGLYLRSVARHSNDGKHKYSHTYTEYDNEGRVLNATMIGAAGPLSLAHDATGCRLINSRDWSQTIPMYGVDFQGNIITVEGTDSLGDWQASYTYNNHGQLSEEDSTGYHAYNYDSRANRIADFDFTYKYNALNELEAKEKGAYNSFDAIDYAYDLNGNMTEKVTYTTQGTYQYDALDRLTSIELKRTCFDKVSIQFVYDAFHRRLSKTVYQWNKDQVKWDLIDKVRYLYEGDREIGSVDSQGNITELRILGCPLTGGNQHSEISAAVAIELNGHAYAPVHDHRGNVGCLIDSASGHIAECYRYSAFGIPKIYSGEGELLEKSAIGNSWMFSSKRSDAESGLVYYGKRYYDADAGRWITKDPLGSFDGDNAYTFLLNNPLSHIDLHGLFSLSTGWENAKEWATGFGQSLSNFKEKNSYSNYIKKDMDQLAENMFGRGFLQFAGYYSHPIESGRSPFGEEIHDKVRITLINGILNVRYDLDTLLKIFSDAHGETPIHYVFRPTEGWTKDVLTSTLSKFGYTSPYARQLAAVWKEMIEEMGGVDGGGKVIHYAHSIGATDTYVAKNLLTPEEQQMIHVITLGSPTMIPHDSGFGSATNYVSKRDGVCFLDPLGYIKGYLYGHSKIEFIGSLWGIPLVDHTLYTDTYGGIIQELGSQFRELYCQ